jgi:hypothetical protein
VIKTYLSYSWLFPTPIRFLVPRPPGLANRASGGNIFV